MVPTVLTRISQSSKISPTLPPATISRMDLANSLATPTTCTFMFDPSFSITSTRGWMVSVKMMDSTGAPMRPFSGSFHPLPKIPWVTATWIELAPMSRMAFVMVRTVPPVSIMSSR